MTNGNKVLLRVAAAGCNHGHDLLNRVRGTYQTERLFPADAEQHISHMEVPAAIAWLEARTDLRFVDVLHKFTPDPLAFATAVGLQTRPSVTVVLRSRVQPHSLVTMTGKPADMGALCVDFVQSGLYDMEAMFTPDTEDSK